ncbi:DENN domain-containing protein 1B isoform X2 [Neoarius graeffei]|uniref:DENN domain-containing protein 1B isoform X2 n=1 Tax=Neoarius graeffei TaxID=443677 RepID=UPI00298CC544|nr:DENN domain-containing protein 1B isoform X2 [Neoarius graeffei]
MGSRLKENPERTFYWFFQASCPIARDKDPGLLFQFPEDFNDEECLKSLPRFCFPYDIERVRDGVAVQHFTFALTDLEGCQRFGFCRLTSSSQTCLCILSYLPWFEVFYKLLNNLADYVTKGQTSEMRELLAALYKHPVPLVNSLNTLPLMPYFIAPDPKTLPSIPENRNLTELIVAVDVGNLLQLYASMLFERRILICCSKLSTLTACVHACSGMIFPMYWQHIFIPVLPPHLLDYCCAPMPYLIGVHSSLIERVKNRALEDVVILNVDTNTMESPHDDLKRLPTDVVTALKVRLKRQAAFTGSGVAKAFLRAQALLFGAYKDALQYPSGQPVSFCEESFLTHKSPNMRQFLESAIHLQFFKQFIDERLEMLNQGKEPDDLFEEEILQCGASSGGSKSYQQWMGNLKKGGGSLILTVKSKAQMYKNVTCHSKLKNLISSKEQKRAHALQRGGSVCGTHSDCFNKSDCLQNRLPITQHFGKSRPRRPPRRAAGQQGEEMQQDNSGIWGEESHVELASDDLTEEEELSMMADLEEMDLLGEIFETLNTQSTTEPGLLYGTRSLDVFTSDCTDFISRRSLATPSQESLSLSTGINGSLMSWEEGLEEGPDIEEEESVVPSNEPESDMRDGVKEGHSTSGGEEEPSVDLGRLVEDLVDLKQELEEELNGNCKETNRLSREDQEEVSRLSREDQEETSRLAKEDQKETSRLSREDQEETNRSSEVVEGEASRSLGKHHQENSSSPGANQERTCQSKPDDEDDGESSGAQEREEREAINKKCHGIKHWDQTQDNIPGSLPRISHQEKEHLSAEQLNAAKNDEEQEECQDPSGPKLLSKVAMFQVKPYQTKSFPETVKPSYGHKITDTSLKISPRASGALWVTASTKADDSAIKSPTLPSLSDTATEDEDLPPPKVSELKKRFEQ